MHRNPYASLATDEPRFQRPNSSTEVEGFKRGERVEGSGFKRGERVEGSGFKRGERVEGFKRGERVEGSGFKRGERVEGFKRGEGSGFKRGERVEGFKRGERVERGEGFKRGEEFKRGESVEGFKVEASSFPSLNGSSVKTVKTGKTGAPVWVVGQDTAKVIERALQTKTPPPPLVQSYEPTFEPEPVGMSSDEEDIPTFEEVYQGGSWGDSNWDD